MTEQTIGAETGGGRASWPCLLGIYYTFGSEEVRSVNLYTGTHLYMYSTPIEKKIGGGGGVCIGVPAKRGQTPKHNGGHS